MMYRKDIHFPVTWFPLFLPASFPLSSVPFLSLSHFLFSFLSSFLLYFSSFNLQFWHGLDMCNIRLMKIYQKQHMPCKVIKGTDDYNSMRKLYPNILKPLFNKCRVIIKTKNLTFSFEYCNKSKICQFTVSFHILKES